MSSKKSRQRSSRWLTALCGLLQQLWDAHGRPRSRILHPIWEWNGEPLVGWIGTTATPMKRAHLNASRYISISYWSPSQDTCLAECRASWVFDDDGRTAIWNRFLNTPEPLGYNPTIIPPWTSPTCEAFADLRLDRWRIRVMPATVLRGQGKVLRWQAP